MANLVRLQRRPWNETVDIKVELFPREMQHSRSSFEHTSSTNTTAQTPRLPAISKQTTSNSSIRRQVKMCQWFREQCTNCNLYLGAARSAGGCGRGNHPANAANTTIGRAKCNTCKVNDPNDPYNKSACWFRHRGQFCQGRSAGGGPNCALPTTTPHGR